MKGPAFSAGVVSDKWLVLFELGESDDLGSTPYVIKARPRAGGALRQGAASTKALDGKHVSSWEWEHYPVLMKDRLFWVDTVPASDTGGSGTVTTAVFSVDLEVGTDAEVAISDGWAPARERCQAEGSDALLYQHMDPDPGAPITLRRRVLDAAGGAVTDEVVWSFEPSSAGELLDEVAACGDTVAMSRTEPPGPDEDELDSRTWIEIRHRGVAHTIEWSKGTASSVSDLTVAKDLVLFAAYNGADEGSRYVFDLATSTLYALPAGPGLAHIYGSNDLVQWTELVDGGDPREGTDTRDMVSKVIPFDER